MHHTRPHQGWDLLATPGTPVYAIADGDLPSHFSSSYEKTATLKFQRESLVSLLCRMSDFGRGNAKLHHSTNLKLAF